MPTEGTARVLRKQMQGDYYTQTSEGLSTLAGVSTGAYNIVNAAVGVQLLEQRTKIDLSGYTREELTFYPTNAIIQQGEFDGFYNVEADGAVWVWDLVTTTRVTDSDLVNWVRDLPGMMTAVPGFLRSNFGLQEIIYGRMRLFTKKTTAPDYFVQTQLKEWGLLSETAGSEIYLTRVLFPATGNTGTISIPEVAFVITGISTKEQDSVYISQLRRTYELQQAP